MDKNYSEVDKTWSTIENKYDYAKTKWFFDKMGIPRFVLLDNNGQRINI